MPAQPQSPSLRSTACGALSVPRKNLGEPDVAARRTASLCCSPLATGRQYAWCLRPPAKRAVLLIISCCSVRVPALFDTLVPTKVHTSASHTWHDEVRKMG